MARLCLEDWTNRPFGQVKGKRAVCESESWSITNLQRVRGTRREERVELKRKRCIDIKGKEVSFPEDSWKNFLFRMRGSCTAEHI